MSLDALPMRYCFRAELIFRGRHAALRAASAF